MFRPSLSWAHVSGSKANAKANISIKLHPVTQGSVSTTKALTSIWGSDKISPQKEAKTGCYTTDYSILVIMNRARYSLQCTDYNHNWFLCVEPKQRSWLIDFFLIDRKLIIQVIFQTKMPVIAWFQPFQCEYRLHFCFMSSKIKYSLGFRVLVGQNRMGKVRMPAMCDIKNHFIVYHLYPSSGSLVSQ